MSWNRQAHLVFAWAIAAASLAGCSGSKSMDPEEVRSKLRSVQSLAAESEMFLDFVLAGHSTRTYAEGHTLYLLDAAEQLRKELERAVPQPGMEESLRECQRDLGALARELSGIGSAIAGEDEGALAVSRGRVRQIRESFKKTRERP